MSERHRVQDPDAGRIGRESSRRVCAATARGHVSRAFARQASTRRARPSVSPNVAEEAGRRSPCDLARPLAAAKASTAKELSPPPLALALGSTESTDRGAPAAHLDDASRPTGGRLRDLRSPDDAVARAPAMFFCPDLASQTSDLHDA